jgi:hypothetical protein
MEVNCFWTMGRAKPPASLGCTMGRTRPAMGRQRLKERHKDTRLIFRCQSLLDRTLCPFLAGIDGFDKTTDGEKRAVGVTNDELGMAGYSLCSTAGHSLAWAPSRRQADHLPTLLRAPGSLRGWMARPARRCQAHVPPAFSMGGERVTWDRRKKGRQPRETACPGCVHLGGFDSQFTRPAIPPSHARARRDLFDETRLP